jgi:hypothetical protein
VICEKTLKGPSFGGLNVCRKSLPPEERAEILHHASCYTSAAQSPQEAIRLSTQIQCAIAGGVPLTECF